jgi:hypothetical protein
MDNDKDADKHWPHCLPSSESPDVPEPTFAHMERPEMPTPATKASRAAYANPPSGQFWPRDPDTPKDWPPEPIQKTWSDVVKSLPSVDVSNWPMDIPKLNMGLPTAREVPFTLPMDAFDATGTGPNSLGGNIAEQQTRKPNYAQGLLATIADQTLPGRFLLAPDIPRRTGTRSAADDPTGRRIDLPAGPAMALRLHPNDPVKAGALIYHPEIPTEFGIPEALNTTHFMPPTYPRGLGQYPPPVMDERGNLPGSPNYNPEDRRNVYVPLGEEPPSSFRK